MANTKLENLMITAFSDDLFGNNPSEAERKEAKEKIMNMVKTSKKTSVLKNINHVADSKSDNFKRFGNIMIDIETLSTDIDNAAVIAIAAVEFNKYTGEVGDSIEFFINPSSWFEKGRNASADTLLWWFEQDKEYLNAIFDRCKNSRIKTYEALYELKRFIDKHNVLFPTDEENVIVWGNGSVMDISILESLYKAYSLAIPWPYWAVNDVRTVVQFNPKIKAETEFVGNKHNPFDDCIHQIKYLSKTIQSLNIKPI